MVSSVYYNKARSPVTVTLRTGEASLVPPKGYLSVTSEQDGSTSLLKLVQKGLLLRRRIAPPVAVEVASEPAAVEPVEAISAKVEEPETQVAEAFETQVIEEPKDVPSAKWSKSRLVAFAKDHALDIDDEASKASVLKSIQDAGL
jgi:hypothetical protein